LYVIVTAGQTCCGSMPGIGAYLELMMGQIALNAVLAEGLVRTGRLSFLLEAFLLEAFG